MSNIEAKDRWAAAKDTLSNLDTIRPNPKNILSSSISLQHGYRQPYSEYYSATTSDGREYCFVDWATADEGTLGYYYGYRRGDGLAFQEKLQEELTKRGFKDKLYQLEDDHDDRKARAKLTEDEFLDFMTANDVLVPGPLPATIETIVQGEGTALWMPKDLYRLTSYYGWVNRQDK